MTARPDAPVSDERLAEMIAGLEDGWIPSADDQLPALRELQRLRAGRVPAEPIELDWADEHD